MANIIRNKSSEAPIVRTILEEIHYWHCVMGKTMNKQCLKYTLSIMDWPAVGSNSKTQKQVFYYGYNIVNYNF